MSTPKLSDLVAVSTAADILGLELGVAQTLGLPTTSWQPLDPSRTMLQVNANIASIASGVVNLIAQGAYATTAAAMVDANGNPITAWMDLRGVDQYNVTRIPATLAAGTVSLVNAGPTSYPYSPNAPLRFQNATTGATYTSTGTGTVAGSTTTNVNFQADASYTGAIGTSAAGVTLVLLTPLAQVTVSALAASAIGSNAEANAPYLARCQEKLGTLSPNGNALAYEFVASSLPVFGEALPDGTIYTAPTANNPYGVKAPVTRVGVLFAIGSGIIDVYTANASAGLGGCAQLAITNVTWAAGVATVTTVSAHDLSVGDFLIIQGVNGATGVDNTIAGVVAWQATAGTAGSTIKFSLATNPGSYTSGGSVEGGDLGMVDAAIQSLTVPQGQTALVQSASTVSVNLVCTVYISTKAGVTSANAVTNIEDAVAAYLGGIPIGGVNAESSGIVPWSELLTTVSDANKGTVSVVLTGPAGDVSVGAGAIPILNSSTITVVFV